MKIKRVDLRKIHPGMEIKVTVVWVGGPCLTPMRNQLPRHLTARALRQLSQSASALFVSAHDKIDRLGNCDSGLTLSRAPTTTE